MSKQSIKSQSSAFASPSPKSILKTTPSDENIAPKEVKIAIENENDFDLYEEQDKLIEEGIRLICGKINQLFSVVLKNGLDLDPIFKSEHKDWQKKIISMHYQLAEWEVKHNGQ